MDFITTCRPKIRKKRSTDFTLWENKRVSFISSIFWLQSERLEPKNDTSTTVGFKQELTLYIKTYTYSSYYPVCISIVTEKKNLSENHKLVWSSFPLISWSSCEIQQWSALFIRDKLNAYVGCSSFAQKLNFSRRGSIIGKAGCPVLSKKDIMLIQIELESSYFNVLNVYTNNWPILIRTLASQCRVKE